jgi:hypothetical protein
MTRHPLLRELALRMLGALLVVAVWAIAMSLVKD